MRDMRKYRIARKRMYDRRRAAGVCLAHPKRAVLAGYVYCQECVEWNRWRWKNKATVTLAPKGR